MLFTWKKIFQPRLPYVFLTDGDEIIYVALASLPSNKQDKYLPLI